MNEELKSHVDYLLAHSNGHTYFDDAIQELVKAAAERDRLRAALGVARKALSDVDETNEMALSLKAQAEGIVVEVTESPIRILCEKWGYGAIMGAVARLWYRKDNVGCFTLGQCYRTVEVQQAKVKEALAEIEGIVGVKNDRP